MQDEPFDYDMDELVEIDEALTAHEDDLDTIMDAWPPPDADGAGRAFALNDPFNGQINPINYACRINDGLDEGYITIEKTGSGFAVEFQATADDARTILRGLFAGVLLFGMTDTVTALEEHFDASFPIESKQLLRLKLTLATFMRGSCSFDQFGHRIKHQLDNSTIDDPSQ